MANQVLGNDQKALLLDAIVKMVAPVHMEEKVDRLSKASAIIDMMSDLIKQGDTLAFKSTSAGSTSQVSKGSKVG